MIILLTMSTLHNVCLMNKVSTPFHIEIESICGAGLPELVENWSQAYGKVRIRQSIVLVGGCNDLLKYNVSDADTFMKPIV